MKVGKIIDDDFEWKGTGNEECLNGSFVDSIEYSVDDASESENVRNLQKICVGLE